MTTTNAKLAIRRAARTRRWFWASAICAALVALIMTAGAFTYCQFGVAWLGELCVDVCCGGATHVLFDWRPWRPGDTHYGFNWTAISFPRHISGWDAAQFRAYGIYPHFAVLGHQINVVMPWWIPLAICLTTAALARRARRWDRPRKGLCIRCGYNLTGNTAGRCPGGLPTDALAIGGGMGRQSPDDP